MATDTTSHESLCAALACDPGESGTGLYALIDLANLPTEARRLQREFQATNAQCLLGDVALATQLASPWLVPLPTRQTSISPFRASADLAFRSAAVSWLRSELPLPELARRLHARTHARLPDRYDVLLRHFDPRVLPVLHDVLTAHQQAAFFALGLRWHYLDRESSPCSISLSTAPAVDAFSAPLQLDDGQAGELLDAAEIDAVMPELAKEAPDRFLALGDGAARFRFTRHWLGRAKHWKLEPFSQKVVLCMLALNLGERFDERAPWQPALAAVAEGRMTLTDAVEQAAGAVQRGQEAAHAG